jgi:hypothetical protein
MTLFEIVFFLVAPFVFWVAYKFIYAVIEMKDNSR